MAAAVARTRCAHLSAAVSALEGIAPLKLAAKWCVPEAAGVVVCAFVCEYLLSRAVCCRGRDVSCRGQRLLPQLRCTRDSTRLAAAALCAAGVTYCRFVQPHS